uniref:GPN-loop GTPase 3 n=1 Tax=Cercocebus atys TaxID=9531 RepID=A0A2K5N7I5_CERAT
VMGPSTYCATMVQHCEALNRSVQVINLDPKKKKKNYSVMADIRELIKKKKKMEDDSLRFGPNGEKKKKKEYFANNFDWLEKKKKKKEDDYILFDCPGQIELYTHLPVMKQLVQQLEHSSSLFCLLLKKKKKILAALSAMISLEIPQVNIMTKMDLSQLKKKKKNPKKKKKLEDSTSDLRSKKKKKKKKAICGLIDDYSMVRFLPYDQSDEESMNIVLQHIDFAIQYGEDLEFKEPKEREDESSSMFDEYFQECQDE